MYFFAPADFFHETLTDAADTASAETPVGADIFEAAEQGTASDTAAIINVSKMQNNYLKHIKALRQNLSISFMQIPGRCSSKSHVWNESQLQNVLSSHLSHISHFL